MFEHVFGGGNFQNLFEKLPGLGCIAQIFFEHTQVQQYQPANCSSNSSQDYPTC